MKLDEYTYVCDNCGQRIHIDNELSHDMRDAFQTFTANERRALFEALRKDAAEALRKLNA